MTHETYNRLWDDIISKAINDYPGMHKYYKLTVNEEKLKQAIYNAYEREYKPLFKSEFMADSEDEDNSPSNGEKKVKMDRHKVAALLYLAIVGTDYKPFIKLNERDNNCKVSLFACHEIAYNVSLNCMHSFIVKSHEREPNCPHKNKFLNNKGFEKSPDLICEKYASYKESIIPRMIWATSEMSFDKSRYVRVNANMLANIFYFLESHSAL